MSTEATDRYATAQCGCLALRGFLCEACAQAARAGRPAVTPPQEHRRRPGVHPLVAACRQARLDQRLSVEQVATVLGVSAATVRAWESGRRQPPLRHAWAYVELVGPVVLGGGAGPTFTIG